MFRGIITGEFNSKMPRVDGNNRGNGQPDVEVNMNSILKTCAKCKEPKPTTEFYKGKRYKDGLQSYCKPCSHKTSREWNYSEKGLAYWQELNQTEEERERKRAYAKTDAGKESLKKRQRRYRNTKKGQAARERYNKSKKNKLRQAEYDASPAGIASRKRYNRSKVGRENQRRFKAARRARKAKNGGSFTVNEWLSLCELYNHRCVCCKKKRKLEADHVIPIVKGGTSYIENIQPLCRKCNARKGSSVIDYRRE